MVAQEVVADDRTAMEALQRHCAPEARTAVVFTIRRRLRLPCLTAVADAIGADAGRLLGQCALVRQRLATQYMARPDATEVAFRHRQTSTHAVASRLQGASHSPGPRV